MHPISRKNCLSWKPAYIGANIPIIGFPDPNYGIKAINYNKLPSPIVGSLLAPLCITQRPFTYTFVGPNTDLYIPNRRQFSIDLKNKVNINIRGSNTPIKINGTKGCFEFYYKDMPFWNFDHANVTGVQQRWRKQHQFYKR